MKKAFLTADVITDEYISDVVERLKKNKRIRRSIPGGGRLHIDRSLPFLCIYRKSDKDTESGSDKIIRTVASYAVLSGKNTSHKNAKKLIKHIIETLSAHFYAFLLLEMWSAPVSKILKQNEYQSLKPSFRIFTNEQKESKISGTLKILKEQLSNIVISKQDSDVEVVYSKKTIPPGCPALVVQQESKKLNCYTVGIEIHPVYKNPHTNKPYPLIRKALLEQLHYTLQYTFFEFSRSLTNHEPSHYHEVGRSFLSAASRKVDDAFTELCSMIDFLRQASPINEAEARADFGKSRYEKDPVFYYRPLPFDPADFKRKLWNIPIEDIEDSAIGSLFYQKREELDTQISMLSNLDSPYFLYGSLQLYGAVSTSLEKTANKILDLLPGKAEPTSERNINSAKFLEFAKNEVAFYKRKYSGFNAGVEVNKDMYSGILVSRDNLLIGKEFKVPYSRVNPLIQHEIGTHLITYFNGLAQPFKQLHIGFAGYDELQEGLAVLSEYLVGGLNASRLRLLAARVIAASYMTDNASFTDTFRILTEEFGFSRFTAFTVVMRIYRGGGLTKDAIYLRGFLSIIDYLKNGGDIEPLFAGKISSEHIPIIKELQIRNILKPVPLYPRYLSNPESLNRLKGLRKGFSIINYSKKISNHSE